MDTPETRRVEIDPVIRAVCQQVKKFAESPEDWDDPATPRVIITGNINGVYAFGAQAFRLLWFDDDWVRYECDMSLEDVERTLSGEITVIELKKAEGSEPKPVEVILPIDQELMDLCLELNAMGRSHDEWKQHEIDSGWESENFVAGFYEDGGFFFRWYDYDGVEYFFNIAYEELPKVIAGDYSKVRARREMPETSDHQSAGTDLR